MTDTRRKKKAAPKKISSKDLAVKTARAAQDLKGYDIVMFDVSGLVDYADFMVITSGRSATQTRAIAEKIIQAGKEAGCRPLGIEGEREGNWILVDWGEVVVHVFYQPVREFYDLEAIWDQADMVQWKSR